ELVLPAGPGVGDAGRVELRRTLRQHRVLVGGPPLDGLRPRLTVGPGHRECRRIAVAQQVNAVTRRAQRGVDLQTVITPRTRGQVLTRLVPNVGRVVHRLTLFGVRGFEVVDSDTERVQLRTVHPQSGAERVVGEDPGVAELLSVGVHDDLALVGVHRTEGEGDDDAQDAEVEHQVAGLAQVAAFGADRAHSTGFVPFRDPPAAQPAPHRGDDLVGVTVDL